MLLLVSCLLQFTRITILWVMTITIKPNKDSDFIPFVHRLHREVINQNSRAHLTRSIIIVNFINGIKQNAKEKTIMSRKGLFGVKKKPLTKQKKNSFRPPLPPKGKMTSNKNEESRIISSDNDEIADMLQYIKTGDRNCIIKQEDKLSGNDLMDHD